MKIQEKQGTRVLSRGDLLAYRNEIFGLAAIWIILFHVYGNVRIGLFRGSFWVANYLNLGNSSVDIFLLLSAIGLSASMGKNTVGAFYRNRLLRVAVPFLLAAVPYFLWYDFGYARDGAGQFLLNISTLNYWLTDSYPVWYVAFIAVAYALYPLLHRLDRKTHHVATIALMAAAVVFEYVCWRTGSVIYDNAERALSRIPVFLLGMLLAPWLLENRDRKIPLYWVAAALTGWVGIFCVLSLYPPHLIISRYLYGVMSVCFVVVFSWVRKFLPCRHVNRLLAWLGGRSLEIYVVHVLLLRVIGYFDLWAWNNDRTLWYALIVAAAVLLASALKQLSGAVNHLLKRK